MNEHYLSGIGMTSQRTRNRLVQRLQEAGIRNEEVLNVIATTPRHLFVDEALAHRAYEDTALPIGQWSDDQPALYGSANDRDSVGERAA